jgi:hypothetical protein
MWALLQVMLTAFLHHAPITMLYLAQWLELGMVMPICWNDTPFEGMEFSVFPEIRR